MKKFFAILFTLNSTMSLASDIKMDCAVTKCEEIGPSRNGFCGFITRWQLRTDYIANTASSLKGNITSWTESEMFNV